MISALAVLVWVLSIICVVLMLRVSHWKSEWDEIAGHYARLMDTHQRLVWEYEALCESIDKKDVEESRDDSEGRGDPPILRDVSSYPPPRLVQTCGVRTQIESVPGVSPAVGRTEPGAAPGGGGG